MLVRDPGSDKILALFTTDRRNGVERVVARYAHRWPIETAIAAGKQLLGIGQARNRLRRAVERTVPFSSSSTASSSSGTRCTATTETTSTPDATPSPGTGTRTTSPSKLLAKLRRTLLAAQITGVAAAQPDPNKYRDYELACSAAAA